MSHKERRKAIKDVKEADTNARLMDLLEAAKQVEAAIQGLKLDDALRSATDKLYAAIAKAEGR